MDMEDFHSQPRKRWRIGNGGSSEARIGHSFGGRRQADDDGDDDDCEGNEAKDTILSWHPSRIVRVSRASGGKDRHSKVLTAKGLRDRRVRLSVSTAIQFYDLQDRLGFDQPSKAVEWLIKKAADAIAELPPLGGAFPCAQPQARKEKLSEIGIEPEVETEPNGGKHQTQMFSRSKSACSSTSETSKGSVLSLSRSEIRVKARERARERAAKEKEEKEPLRAADQSTDFNSLGSFTELLTGYNRSVNFVNSKEHVPYAGLDPKQLRYFPPSYLGQAAMVPAVSRSRQSSDLTGQTIFGAASLNPMSLNITSTPGDHSEILPFSFLPNHVIPAAAALSNDCNLNFPISSSLSGFCRGTLQSNPVSPIHLPRFPSPVDGSSVPFFIGLPENQLPAGSDARFQLFYGDVCRQSDLKGKGKN